MGRFSASKSGLLAACGYPFRDDVNAPDTEPGSDARIGTVAWARVVAHIEGRPDPGNGEGLTPDEANDVDAYVAAGLTWAKEHARLGWRCEVAFAWSPSGDTARQLPKSDKLRDYYHDASCPPDCIRHVNGDEQPGSTDVVTMADDAIEVIDVKTGVTPLEQYIPQVRTLAVMAARTYGVSRARVRLVKLHKDAPAEEWSDTLRRADLDAIAEELAGQLAAAQTAEPSPGPHCNGMWCPARVVCPVVPAAVEQLVPAEALVRLPAFSAKFISHDHDAQQLELLRLVEAAAKQLKDAIKKRTPAGGVVLADGRLLREGFHTESKWKQEALIAKVRELGVRMGLTDEQIDIALDECRYSFEKSEGLKVLKAPKGRAA